MPPGTAKFLKRKSEFNKHPIRVELIAHESGEKRLEKAASAFLTTGCNVFSMEKRFTILRGITRSVVDFCVLPGTATGAEILWIYTMQWKNRASLVLIGLLSFVYSNMHMVIEDHLTGKNINGPENTR